MGDQRKIRLDDFRTAFDGINLPNVSLFKVQTAVLQDFLSTGTQDEAQQKDVDFLLALGELFALVVYAQLILENARIYAADVDNDLLDQIFDCLVRDFSSMPCSSTQNRAAQSGKWSFACACCASRWRTPDASIECGSRCTP